MRKCGPSKTWDDQHKTCVTEHSNSGNDTATDSATNGELYTVVVIRQSKQKS